MCLYRKWSERAAENARQLAVEARLLFDSGHFPRAYYLSHMAMEESAKSILLWSMGANSNPGDELPKIKALLRNHKKKIELVVNYAITNSAELKERIGNRLPELIAHINNLKNDTMYVSIERGEVLTPTDKISSIDVNVHLTVAEGLAGLVTKMKITHSN